MTKKLPRRVIDPPETPTPEVGTWLWALSDGRKRLISVVKGATLEILDHEGATSTNTIGTLLYHIAATDMSWLYMDILQKELDDEARKLLPYPYHDDEGRLFPVRGVSIEDHLERLSRTRELLMRAVRNMTLDDFRRIRRLESYETHVEWVLYHLCEHESFHRGQISEIQKRAVS